MSSPAVKWIIRIVVLLLCLAVTVGAVAWLMRSNATANEVITGAMGLLASIFTSPFILEATLALIGLVIVLCYNQYRRERDDKDEWVLLPKSEASTPPTDKEG